MLLTVIVIELCTSLYHGPPTDTDLVILNVYENLYLFIQIGNFTDNNLNERAGTMSHTDTARHWLVLRISVNVLYVLPPKYAFKIC